MTWQLLFFLLAVALATCAQMTTGFAFALVLLGLSGVFHLAPLADAANVASVLTLGNALLTLRSAHGTIDRSILRDTTFGTVVGTGIGVALLAWLSGNVVSGLRVLLGVTVIACALVVLLQKRPLPQRSGSAGFAGFGLLSGLLGGLFSAGGPPLVYQFYRQPLDLVVLRQTLTIALAAGNLIRLTMVLASGQFSRHALLLCLVAAPVVAALTWWLRTHPPGWPLPVVRRIVVVLLLATGAGLVAPAFA